jgi:hypothetical protein
VMKNTHRITPSSFTKKRHPQLRFLIHLAKIHRKQAGI